MKFSGICLITEDVSHLMAFYKDIMKAKAVGDENNARILIEGSYIDVFSKQGMESMAPGSTDGNIINFYSSLGKES